jgi:hypothetical protein
MNLDGVVRQLKLERQKAQNEMKRFDAALDALGTLASGKAPAQKRRAMSASARKRIAAAQRKRWKLWKAEKKAA